MLLNVLLSWGSALLGYVSYWHSLRGWAPQWVVIAVKATCKADVSWPDILPPVDLAVCDRGTIQSRWHMAKSNITMKRRLLTDNGHRECGDSRFWPHHAAARKKGGQRPFWSSAGWVVVQPLTPWVCYGLQICGTFRNCRRWWVPLPRLGPTPAMLRRSWQSRDHLSTNHSGKFSPGWRLHLV